MHDNFDDSSPGVTPKNRLDNTKWVKEWMEALAKQNTTKTRDDLHQKTSSVEKDKSDKKEAPESKKDQKAKSGSKYFSASPLVNRQLVVKRRISNNYWLDNKDKVDNENWVKEWAKVLEKQNSTKTRDDLKHKTSSLVKPLNQEPNGTKEAEKDKSDKKVAPKNDQEAESSSENFVKQANRKQEKLLITPENTPIDEIFLYDSENEICYDNPGYISLPDTPKLEFNTTDILIQSHEVSQPLPPTQVNLHDSCNLNFPPLIQENQTHNGQHNNGNKDTNGYSLIPQPPFFKTTINPENTPTDEFFLYDADNEICQNKTEAPKLKKLQASRSQETEALRSNKALKSKAKSQKHLEAKSRSEDFSRKLEASRMQEKMPISTEKITENFDSSLKHKPPLPTIRLPLPPDYVLLFIKACTDNQIDDAKKLIKKSRQIVVKAMQKHDNMESTLLQLVVRHGNLEFVKLLVRSTPLEHLNVLIETENRIHGEPALFTAINMGSTIKFWPNPEDALIPFKIVKYLVKSRYLFNLKRAHKRAAESLQETECTDRIRDYLFKILMSRKNKERENDIKLNDESFNARANKLLENRF